MSIEDFIIRIISSISDDIYILILFTSIIFMINYSFTKKFSKKRTILIWGVICTILEFVMRTLYLTQQFLANRYESFFTCHELIYNFVCGWGVWVFILQILALVIGASILYKETQRTTLFVCVTLYLFVSIIADYIMPIALVIINPTVNKQGMFIQVVNGGGGYYILIGIVTANVLYWIYKKILHDVLKVLYYMEKTKILILTIIGAISYISYTIIYLILSVIGVYPINSEGLWQFVIIIGNIDMVYVIMYVALFIGVKSAVTTTKLQSDLEIAERIQKACLPNGKRVYDDKLEVYGYMQPAKQVGGDFYDHFKLDDDTIAFVIADVSDKGVSAALFMMMAKTALKNNAMRYQNICEILENVNDELFDNNSANMFVTCFFGLLNIKTGSFKYVNAGHNYPIIKQGENSWRYMNGKNSFVLAGFGGIKYRENEIKLKKGDILFLYTDGVTEACNENADMYGEERLIKELEKIDKEKYTVKEIINNVRQDVKNYVGSEEQSDDITMLIFQYRGQYHE